MFVAWQGALGGGHVVLPLQARSKPRSGVLSASRCGDSGNARSLFASVADVTTARQRCA